MRLVKLVLQYTKKKRRLLKIKRRITIQKSITSLMVFTILCWVVQTQTPEMKIQSLLSSKMSKLSQF